MNMNVSCRIRSSVCGAVVSSVLAAIAVAGPSAAFAQRDRHARPPVWRGDIARFHEHDWAVWRSGRWAHQWHDGRMGWWWVVGGVWYFYPSPVYPYPSPWEPPPAPWVNPPAAAVPPPPPTPYWYFCEATRAYYPYVATCAGGWKQVPAVPGNVSPEQPK
jgi:hypothetical protein